MAICLTCNKEFEIRPWFKKYCSSECKGKVNVGMPAWNKGRKMSDEEKSKLNLSGLKLGHGWNKGIPNQTQRIKWKENNPNKDGRVNIKRKENGTTTFIGQNNPMYGKNHSTEAKKIQREFKLKNYTDGIYKSKSKEECEFAKQLKKTFKDLIWQYRIDGYHRVYDFYIPSLNIIIEYDGDYWHREEKYIKKDIKDTEKAIKEGYSIFRYWSSTVKNVGIEKIIEDISKLDGKYSRKLTEET